MCNITNIKNEPRIAFNKIDIHEQFIYKIFFGYTLEILVFYYYYSYYSYYGVKKLVICIAQFMAEVIDVSYYYQSVPTKITNNKWIKEIIVWIKLLMVMFMTNYNVFQGNL